MYLNVGHLQAWAVANLQPWRGSPFRQPKQRRAMFEMAMNHSPASKMGQSNTAAVEPKPCSEAQTVSQTDGRVSGQQHRQGNVLKF